MKLPNIFAFLFSLFESEKNKGRPDQSGTSSPDTANLTFGFQSGPAAPAQHSDNSVPAVKVETFTGSAPASPHQEETAAAVPLSPAAGTGSYIGFPSNYGGFPGGSNDPNYGGFPSSYGGFPTSYGGFPGGGGTSYGGFPVSGTPPSSYSGFPGTSYGGFPGGSNDPNYGGFPSSYGGFPTSYGGFPGGGGTSYGGFPVSGTPPSSYSGFPAVSSYTNQSSAAAPTSIVAASAQTDGGLVTPSPDPVNSALNVPVTDNTDPLKIQKH